MIHRSQAFGLALVLLPLTASPALAAAPAASVPGALLQPLLQPRFQDGGEEEEKPDKRPEIEELLEQLDAHIDARGDEDLEAIAIVDKLISEWPESGPKDRKSILKGLNDCFRVKRKDTPEGGRDNKLYLASAVALGEMGPDSAKTISSWIDHKSHRSDIVLQRQLLLSLGKTKDPKAIGELTDQLLNKYPELTAAAAEGLAHFGDSPEDVRKEIFKEVLKIFGGAKVQVDQDPQDTVARERYDKIEASMITTLQIMSGQQLRDAAEWQSWWNDNKKKNWDEEL